jgi:hypothetical protein
MEDTSLSSGKPAQNLNTSTVATNSSSGKLRPVNPSARALLTLLCVAAIFLIVVFLIIEGVQKVANYNGLRVELPVDTSLLLVNNNPVKNKAYDFLILASKANNPKDKSADFAKAYILMSTAYQASPEANFKEQLVNLYNYLQKNYPASIKQNNLVLPCVGESCSLKYVYSSGLTSIKQAINSNTVFDASYKQQLVKDIDSVASAAFTKNKVLEFNNLLSVFSGINAYAKENPDPSLALLLAQIKSELKAINANYYSFVQGEGLLKTNEK